MKVNITTKESNMICDPIRVWRKCGKKATAGENIAFGIGGLIDFAVELAPTILEGVLYRAPVACCSKKGTPLLNKNVEIGYVDLPDRYETENLLDLKNGNDENFIKLREDFYKQYSDKYSLHRLDFNITPNINNSKYRIMSLEPIFKFDKNIRGTDVLPQTKWVKEGMSVSDTVGMTASGNFTPNINFKESEIKGEGALSKNYFYKINFETEVPCIEGKSMSDGFGWLFRGTYERFIATDTKKLTAILLVPKNIKEANISLDLKIGVTDNSRKGTDYPATNDLTFFKMETTTSKVVFGKKN